MSDPSDTASSPGGNRPLVSYGIAPRLRQNWRRGMSIYEPPGRVVPEGKVHALELFEDESFRIKGLEPTLQEFVTHAKRYGVDGVLEAARPCLGERELARLTIEVDAIEAGRTSAHGVVVGKRRRRSHAETLAAVQTLSVEGFVVPAIATKLDLSVDTVKACLRETERNELGKSKNEARKPA